MAGMAGMAGMARSPVFFAVISRRVLKRPAVSHMGFSPVFFQKSGKNHDEKSGQPVNHFF